MILTVSGLHFQYNSYPVLRGVSFHLHRGKILAVLGVNGAGKSTLLKCVNRVIQPRKGTVLLNDQDLSRMNGTDVAKRIGYVPQRHGEEPLTVFDAVLLGRRPYITWSAAPKDLETVERILHLMNLEGLALRPVNHLSGGEVQKVMIARALAQEPELLLLDEPTSNLDLRNQLEVMRLVKEAVRTREISAIIAVHDLNLALRFADFFLFLKDGKVHTVGDATAVTKEVIHEVYGVQVILSAVSGYPVVIAFEDYPVRRHDEKIG